MKVMNLVKKAGFLTVLGLSLASCEKEPALKESIFDITEKPLNQLDQWIRDSYVNPYNIRATYKWNQAFGYYDKTLYPPKVENVEPALRMVKKLWIDTYSDSRTGGERFVKRIAPRELHLIGSYNVNNNGTITLGEAGGGARITLFNVDYVKYDDLESINMFIHTVQHEYVHILNQSKPYDKEAWSKISDGGLYTSSWHLEGEEVSNELGFVTSYARSNYDEDIAETTSFILLKPKADWEAFLKGIKSEKARKDILAKVDIVVKYYEEQFNIDFWKLRDVAEQNTKDVMNGNF